MTCCVCGRDDSECRIRKIKGMTLCPKHVTQYYRHGKFMSETRYDNNEYIIDEDICKIVLKNNNCEIVGYAIIDTKNIDKCKQYKWHLRCGKHIKYAETSVGNHKLPLHRLIIDCPQDMVVDHINHDGLDNREDNLFICTHSRNGANRSKTGTGVKKVPSGRYQAMIMKDSKPIYIGTFDTYEEAIKARSQKFEELFG